MNRSDKFEHIRTIADAICEKQVSAEQVNRLDQLLANDPEAQQFYYDYIEMHVQMQADVGPPMEVVRRRLQVDEVIIRPTGQQAITPTSVEFGLEPSPEQEAEPKPVLNSATGFSALPSQSAQSPQSTLHKWLVLLTSLIVVVLVLVILLFANGDKEDHIAEIINDGLLQIDGQGKIEADLVYAGLYTTNKETKLTLVSGELLHLAPDSQVKFYNSAEIELLRGQLALEQATGKDLVFSGPNFKIHSMGGELAIDLTKGQPEVISSGQSQLVPNRWRPNHYWPFEGNSDRVVDYAGNAFGIPGSGTTKVAGLVGRSAYMFDNGAGARINVGSGGGTAPATGSFSVTDGVTIEALIVPYFYRQLGLDKPLGEHDQIFRKDQSDREHRMLLTFQEGKDNNYLRPKGIVGPSIGFGLYLIGQGYNSLRLPLDGKEGRPSLAQLQDGQAHHIVGSYNVSTGLKAIYVDGEMKASYQYPPGSKMISGGSGTANIGNSPNMPNSDHESYFGIIDEVAFYDFALPAYMIRQHYLASQRGDNYFNANLASGALPMNISIALPANQLVTLDPATGLLAGEQ